MLQQINVKICIDVHSIASLHINRIIAMTKIGQNIKYWRHSVRLPAIVWKQSLKCQQKTNALLNTIKYNIASKYKLKRQQNHSGESN